jgi:peptidoglycan hydrolase CwlO-like protein
MQKGKLLLLLLLSVSVLLLPKAFSFAEPDCNSNNLSGSDIDVCLAKIQHDADALAPANENNKKELANLQAQIASLKVRISNITKQVNSLSTQIAKRTNDLSYAQKVFNEKANNQYKILRLYDPLSAFLESENAKNVFLQIEMRQRAVDGDRLTMEGLSKDLSKLASDKAALEKSKTSLASLQASVDKRATFLTGEVAKVEDYLAKLSSRQEELLAQKAGGFETSVGDTPPTLDPCSGAPGTASFCDPGFRPAFAGFSFGAPHRTGMSQYGALGRSKSGQNAETILSAYYQGSSLRKDYPDTTIGVTGYGRKPIEEYLLGLYEVPESWGDQGGFEALKAQAVAARSYALSVTNNGAGSICTTEACQVYKPQLKSGKWAEAVRATKGWVLMKDGQPAKAYFAASSGGYTISQWGWSGIKDTSGEWPGTSYEKVGGSPWFYKGWFRSRSGATCGLNNPWLTSAQMADILNAWQVLFNGGGDQSRISPPDKCFGGNPYSTSELASIGGFSSVSGVSVVYGNDGSTKQVTFQTNKGSVTIGGDDLKKAFNLRAPGNVGIKSSLYNIEKL